VDTLQQRTLTIAGGNITNIAACLSAKEQWENRNKLNSTGVLAYLRVSKTEELCMKQHEKHHSAEWLKSRLT
jgi:hypothetical protein